MMSVSIHHLALGALRYAMAHYLICHVNVDYGTYLRACNSREMMTDAADLKGRVESDAWFSVCLCQVNLYCMC